MTGFVFQGGETVYPHFPEWLAEGDPWELKGRCPGSPGIGMGENTAIVVDDDQFEVIGVGMVGVFDREITARKTYNPFPGCGNSRLEAEAGHIEDFHALGK